MAKVFAYIGAGVCGLGFSALFALVAIYALGGLPSQLAADCARVVIASIAGGAAMAIFFYVLHLIVWGTSKKQ